jgi:hypothetical protein
MVDPPGKARHCTLMLMAAAVLADCAPEDVQKRALARYSFLFADAALEWMRRWRNQLKRDTSTKRHAAVCKPRLQRLEAALDDAGDIRDYLAAKRQPKDAVRASDLEATAELWAAVNPATVSEIGIAAIEAFDSLSKSPPGTTIAQWVGLDATYGQAVTDALPRRDPGYWYAAADSSADLRPNTLPIAQGGPIGRRVAEINDVAEHLDVLLRLAPILDGALLYDWLIRSALAVELNTLFDLVVGSPPGQPSKVVPLLELCRSDRSEDGKVAVQDFRTFRRLIGEDGWVYIRWMRNSIGAHLDEELTLFDVHRHLMEFDYPGVVRLAEASLDFLDEVGSNRLGLKLLLLGERKIGSWPIDPAIEAPGRPSTAVPKPGWLADFFRRFDSPYMIVSGSNLGSPMIAGMSVGRKPKPRAPVTVRGKCERYLEPSGNSDLWVEGAVGTLASEAEPQVP